MYKVTYLPDVNQPEVEFREFASYRGMIYFASKFQVDGQVLEIKWYDNVDHRKPDRN
jgi:hypothetical protein